jgi:DeoR/GlpR family transcriptional regulator of sugar metabolism
MDYTVKEYAAKERVDERTVRRWIEKGALDGAVRRTPGGGIRITEKQSRMTNADKRGQSNN